MARRSRTKLYVSKAGATSFTPSLTSLPWPQISLGPSVEPDLVLTAIEDRRTFHPLGQVRPARMITGNSHTPVVAKVSRSKKFRPPRLYPGPGLRFAIPEKTLICLRRKKRKEVLFAKRKTGRRGQRKPRFNWYSRISCSR